MRLAIALLMGCLIASVTIPTNAASIVKATYSHDGDAIALMIYTGPDGGPKSDPAKYWALLGKAPESAYDVKIKPDEAGGKTATLKGEIRVSVNIRNKFSMGTVKIDELTLTRDDGESIRWYIPTDELKRIQALLFENSSTSDSESVDAPARESAEKPENRGDANQDRIASAVIVKVGDGQGIPVASDKLQSIQNGFLDIAFIGKLIQQSRGAKGWYPPKLNSLPDYRLSIRYSDAKTVEIAAWAWGPFYFHVGYNKRQGAAHVYCDEGDGEASKASKFLVSLYEDTREAEGEAGDE